jgi:multiple sugar transport system permease protein
MSSTFKYKAVAPLIIFLSFFSLYGIIMLLRMGVSDITFSGSETYWSFVGLKHLRTTLNDPVVGVALKNTFFYVFMVVIIEGLFGTILALMISRLNKVAKTIRTILLFPILIPPIAIGSMWRLMFDYNYGLINMVLGVFNIVGPTWTADPNLAMWCIIIVDVWHWTSFVFLIVFAGLESLPHGLFEVAEVDGANYRQTLRHIILPLLKPSIVTAVMLRMIFAFKVFDQVYLLTNGGPGTASEVLNLYIYKVYFVQNRLGYGSFLTIILSLIIVVIVVIYRRALRTLD